MFTSPKLKKTKTGRPRAEEARSKTIGIRLTLKELDTLQRKADSAGLSLGQWVREVALSKYAPRPLVPEVNREAYKELARLAGNFNQFVKQREGGFPASMLRDIQEQVQVLRLLLLGVKHDSKTD